MAPADLIPNEIWSNHILSKLTVKSLLRCKCVCKAWNHVVCDPKFARFHVDDKLVITTTCYSNRTSSIDYQASKGINEGDAVKLNLNFPSEVIRHVEILGSSNGLLCVSVTYRKTMYSSDGEDILIWNPTTGDSKLIPNTDLSYHHLIGFSYDSSINDAKIVRLLPLVDIYSMKNNSWNNIIIANYNDIPSFHRVDARGGCLVNGGSSMYWLVCFNSIVYEYKYLGILEFDLREKKFRKLKLPLDFQKSYYYKHLYLKEVGGTLGLFKFSDERFVVWTMKEPGEWTKLVNLDSSFVDWLLFKPISLMRNGKLVVLFREEWNRRSTSRMFALYDPITRRKVEQIGIRSSSEGYIHQAVTYVESLVSPNSISREV